MRLLYLLELQKRHHLLISVSFSAPVTTRADISPLKSEKDVIRSIFSTKRRICCSILGVMCSDFIRGLAAGATDTGLVQPDGHLQPHEHITHISSTECERQFSMTDPSRMSCPHFINYHHLMAPNYCHKTEIQ